MRHTMTCAVCHARFQATRSDADKCSERCRSRAYRVRLRRRIADYERRLGLA